MRDTTIPATSNGSTRTSILPLIDSVDGPVLVIAGGPSVPRDLAYLRSIDFEPAVVLSANDHGFKQSHYPVDYIVCVDNMHSEQMQNMYTLMAPYGVPLISRFWWADYRLVDWKCHVNSGMTAFLVGALMGGKPVVVTGIDGWGPVTYFHNPDVKVACSNRPMGYVTKQLHKTKAYMEPLDVVRVMSGPMLGMFKPFDPAEAFAPGPNRMTYGQKLLNPKHTRYKVCTAKKTFTWELTNVLAGESFIVSEAEAHLIFTNQRIKEAVISDV